MVEGKDISDNSALTSKSNEKQQNIRIAERLGLVQTRSNKDLEKSNSLDDENKERRELEQKQGTKVTVLTIIATSLQIAFLLIMGRVHFKMFSIIPFFMAPIWALMMEAIVLLVIKFGKYDCFVI